MQTGLALAAPAIRARERAEAAGAKEAVAAQKAQDEAIADDAIAELTRLDGTFEKAVSIAMGSSDTRKLLQQLVDLRGSIQTQRLAKGADVRAVAAGRRAEELQESKVLKAGFDASKASFDSRIAKIQLATAERDFNLVESGVMTTEQLKKAQEIERNILFNTMERMVASGAIPRDDIDLIQDIGINGEPVYKTVFRTRQAQAAYTSTVINLLRAAEGTEGIPKGHFDLAINSMLQGALGVHGFTVDEATDFELKLAKFPDQSVEDIANRVVRGHRGLPAGPLSPEAQNAVNVFLASKRVEAAVAQSRPEPEEPGFFGKLFQ